MRIMSAGEAYTMLHSDRAPCLLSADSIQRGGVAWVYVCVYFLRPWGSGRDIKINSTVEARINKRFQVICNTENVKTCGAIPWLNEVSLWQIEGERGGGGECNGAVFGELIMLK